MSFFELVAAQYCRYSSEWSDLIGPCYLQCPAQAPVVYVTRLLWIWSLGPRLPLYNKVACNTVVTKPTGELVYAALLHSTCRWYNL